MLTKGTRGDTMLNQIANIMDEIRKEYPIIGSELDGKIYYMNGNDGTDFDWECNGRVCEFMVFHENELGYIKLLVNEYNTINVYVFQDGGMHPTQELTKKYHGDVYDFYRYLYRKFDMHDLWDEDIESFLEW